MIWLFYAELSEKNKVPSSESGYLSTVIIISFPPISFFNPAITGIAVEPLKNTKNMRIGLL